MENLKDILPASYGITADALSMLEGLNKPVNAPFTNNLPYDGYQNNDVSLAISNAFDGIISKDSQTILDMADNLSHTSSSHMWLDYLALLIGYRGYGFWDVRWSIFHKQRLIRYAMQIWSRMGTRYPIITVMNCLDIPYVDFWEMLGSFITTELPTDTYGGVVAASQDDVNGTQLQRSQPFEAYLRMATSTMRWTETWKLAENIIYYFSPAVTDVSVVYSEFTADLSLAGEPVFS